MPPDNSKDEKKGQQKVESTTEPYCIIAVSESNKRCKVQVQHVMRAFRSQLHKLKKIREASIDSTGNHSLRG